MSRDLPVVFVWRCVEVADDDGVVRDVLAMVPHPRYAKLAAKQFREGEEHVLVVDEPRNMKAHNAYFAQIHDAWESLPETIAHNFPSAEHLRKWALCEAGYCTEQVIDCGEGKAAETAARDVCVYARRADPYARIKRRGNVVIIQTPESQSGNAMRGGKFKTSKDAVLDVISGLIGVTRSELQKHGGRNAG